jgi:hypothetical protein
MELDKVVSAPPPFVDPFLVEVRRSGTEVLRKTVAVRGGDPE